MRGEIRGIGTNRWNRVLLRSEKKKDERREMEMVCMPCSLFIPFGSISFIIFFFRDACNYFSNDGVKMSSFIRSLFQKGKEM